VKRLDTRLAGLVLLEPTVFADDRGFFLETFRRDESRELGVDADFVQDNHSRSTRHTLRGLHFQLRPGQPKLVRVVRGAIVDVVVDIRPSSPTFGEFEMLELDDSRHRQLFVPIGFAHGFCTLSDYADVIYKVGSYYDPSAERGIAWDDSDICIPWPTAAPLVSDRDLGNPRLAEVRDSLPDW
jgi:dTDP-4-dehydrorhamnose 3,5-epimerase